MPSTCAIARTRPSPTFDHRSGCRRHDLRPRLALGAGGHALFIKDHKFHYVNNFLGIKPEQHFVSMQEWKPGKYTLGMEFTRTGADPHHESLRTMKLLSVAKWLILSQPNQSLVIVHYISVPISTV